MENDVILAVKNVNTFYGQIHALRDISFDVKRGEIVTLIGSNGAGKSTTLRTISSQLSPASGEVLYEGKAISRMPAHKVVSLGIAHVPEGRKIFPQLTVEENLEMGAFRLKDTKRIEANMQHAFNLFPRLKERRKQRGGTLSGGEQQMLAIGRALMSDPTLLLMDEPSMGLAPMLVELIFESIVRLNKEGITILLVEQNAKKALKISDRSYVLQTGSIVLSGTGSEMLKNDIVREAYLGQKTYQRKAQHFFQQRFVQIEMNRAVDCTPRLSWTATSSTHIKTVAANLVAAVFLPKSGKLCTVQKTKIWYNYSRPTIYIVFRLM